MSSPINPPVARGVRNGELPAYVSNGLIGLRVREQPLQAGMCLVSGVAGEHAERRIEAAALGFAAAIEACDGIRAAEVALLAVLEARDI